MSSDPYTVVGGGAIGGTLAFALARAGHPVRVIDTDPEHVAAIRAHGLVREGAGGRTAVAVEAATPQEYDREYDGEYDGPPPGRVLLAVKAQATEAAMRWIAPRLATDGWVVSVQNGFNEPLIAGHIGTERTIAAFVNIFADVTGPGVIRDGGEGALVIGEPGGAPVSERVRGLVADLRSWGPARASDNVEGYLWAKAGFGAMLAATALADAPMAELIDRHRPAMHALAAEVFEVAGALGIGLEAFDAFDPAPFRRGAPAAARGAATDRLTAWLRTMPKDRSGIWRDLAVRRRPVEVTTHYATVFTEAERAGLATPVLHAVLDGLRALERDPSGMSESRLDALDRLAEAAAGSARAAAAAAGAPEPAGSTAAEPRSDTVACSGTRAHSGTAARSGTPPRSGDGKPTPTARPPRAADLSRTDLPPTARPIPAPGPPRTAGLPGAPALTAEQARAVQAWLAAHQADMVADLAEYTSVESSSDDPAALDLCLRWLRGWLDAALGVPDSEELLPREGAGDILVRRYGPAGGADATAGPVLLLAHYDTVWPTGTLAEWPFRRDGDRVTGPGVFDMKAGLVQAVWALRALDALGLPRPACTLLLNGDEETGSLASSAVVRREAGASRAALVFEASADGALKTARKGVGLFTLTVTGEEAHAGLDPTAGASAVEELARQVLHLHGLRDLDAGTSVNVGVVRGGTRSNVTAGRATAEFDVRVASSAERARVEAALAALRPVHPGTSVVVDGGWNRPVFERTAAVGQLFELARACADPLGVGLRETSVGGASDGNFVLDAGVPVLDGLGAVGAGAHARTEYALVTAMPERAALAAGVLAAFAPA